MYIEKNRSKRERNAYTNYDGQSFKSFLGLRYSIFTETSSTLGSTYEKQKLFPNPSFVVRTNLFSVRWGSFKP